MDTRRSFDALVAARSRRPRGASEIYSRAAMTPSQDEPPSRWMWRAGAAAAVAALVIGVAVLVGTDGGDQDVVADDADDNGFVDAPVPTPAPEVLSVANPPPGYELVSAVDTGMSSVWTGPAGELTVYQQLSSDGRRAHRVLAIAVAQSDEHTVLDAVTAEHDETTTESIGGHEVTFAAVVASEQTISTFGAFDLARWRAPDGATVTVASRGLDDNEVRGVTQELIGGTAAGDLAATSPTVAEMDQVGADPVRVPSRPEFSSVAQVFESSDYELLSVGTELGDWPAASDLLWWTEGGVLSDHGELQLADGLMYKALADGAATAKGSAGVPDTLLRDVLGDVVRMTRAEWRTLVAEADRSSDHVVTTTTEPPQGD